VKNFIQAVPMLAFNTAGLHAVNFGIINPLGLPNPCSIIKLLNESGSDVFISYNGVVDHDCVARDSYLLINAQGNANSTTKVAQFAKGTKFYVRGAPIAGAIYLIGYYQ